MANETYFGRGEYRIGDHNLGKLVAGCEQFSKDGGWSWKMQDCLGVKLDGTIGSRFGQILASPTVPESLKTAMRAIKPRGANDIHRLNPARGSVERTPQDAEQVARAAEALVAAGWTEEEVKKAFSR